MLAIHTNLVDRFILAYIKEAENFEDSRQNQAETAKKRFNIEIFDTADVSDKDSCDYAVKKPLEFACLLISNWLSKCSIDTNFESYIKDLDPYDVYYFGPLYNTMKRLRDFFDSSNNNDKDRVCKDFFEQMNSVCETRAEKAAFIRDRFLSELSS